MMANGGMESLMQNPLLTQMMSGGGMPDMGALMSDPSIRAMAEQMGALGGAGGARGGGGSDGPEDMYS
jgi:small glutamine-rich tetratricopeptide repeat-containing protein alpha